MKQLYLVAFLLACGLFVNAQYTTSPDRTEGVKVLCLDQGLSKDNLLDEDAKARNQEYMAGMQASFSADGNSLIRTLITDLNSGIEQLTSTATELIIFVVPFALGFIIIIFIWMFLCCCCVCPSCCPSKCCQKNEEEQYTKCELIWPTVVLILALLLSSIAAIIGLSNASDIESSIKTTSCALAFTFDDVINGNISESGKFFAGIKTVGSEFNKLYNNIDDIKADLDTISSSGTIITDITTAGTGTYDQFIADLDLFPTGNINTGSPAGTTDTIHPTITYGQFVSGSANTVDSIMPDTLGKMQDSGSALGALFTVAQETKNAVVDTSTSAQEFSDGVADFKSGFSSVSATIDDMDKMLADTDSSLTSALVTVSEVLAIITIAVSALFGVILGLSVLGIVGALIMTFCNKFKCRYLIYFSCVLLFLIGIVLFLVSTIFALITPVLYYSCEFFTYSTESAANFNQSFGGLLGETADLIGVCLPGSSGNILDTIGGDLTASINGLTDTMAGMQSFGDSGFSDALTTAWENVTDTINDYYTGRVLDFELDEGKNQLIKISDHTQWGCSDYTADSWVPSILDNPDIPCKVNDNNRVDVCAGLACANACFDSQTILAANSGDVSTRYTNGDCTTFNAAVQLVYDNYYSIKDTDYATINANVITFNDADPAVSTLTNFSDSVDAVQTAFEGVFTSLTGSINSIVDPEYGLLAGFNCVIFGEDFNRAIDAICVKFFNTTYLARLTLGISAFGILFAMCCSVCTGVRHYKHSLRLTKLDSFDGGNQESTMANLNQKY